MNLPQAMDIVRNQISAIDGKLSTMDAADAKAILEQLPNPTGLNEQLLVWRINILLEADFINDRQK